MCLCSYACMYVCVYACVCVCVCARVCVCVYACVCVHACMYECVHMCFLTSLSSRRGWLGLIMKAILNWWCFLLRTITCATGCCLTHSSSSICFYIRTYKHTYQAALSMYESLYTILHIYSISYTPTFTQKNCGENYTNTSLALRPFSAAMPMYVCTCMHAILNEKPSTWLTLKMFNKIYY